MALNFFSVNNINEPKMIAISEGVGSGSKLFQSLLDSHDQILMVPGYALMYFYPYWSKYIEVDENANWNNILDRLLNMFASIFDTKINPGSESMHQLGENHDQHILVDLKKFKEKFLEITLDEVISSRNCLLAFHYSYAWANKQDLKNKSVIVYHVHVFDYVSKFLYKDFPDLKVIASIRDPRGNVSRRVVNGIIRPNERKLRKSDAFLIKHKSYRQITRCITEGLDSLHPIAFSQIMVFRHEDLVSRLESVMQNTAKFLEIKYSDILLQPTWGGLIWMTTYYNFDSKKNIANPEILSKKWIDEESKSEIYFIEGMCLDLINKYYDGPIYYSKDNLITRSKLLVMSFIPSKIEQGHILDLLSIRQYLKIINYEKININLLQSYSNNLYYSLKWTNDGVDFSSLKTDFILNHLNKSQLKLNSLSKFVFLISRVMSYIFQILLIPVNIFKKFIICYNAVMRRIRKQAYLPDIL